MCLSQHDEERPDFSEEFYRSHAERYAEVAHELIQSIYVRSSHPALKGDLDLLESLRELVPGRRGLDAGCGAGARHVYQFWLEGYDIYGIDSVEENIRIARQLHPEIADRVSVADMRLPLSFPDESFDFVICSAVIQHIESSLVWDVTLPELARVLRQSGVLQLMFKNGQGTLTVYDRDYGAERSFQLYDEREILQALGERGLDLVEAAFTQPVRWNHVLHRSQNPRITASSTSGRQVKRQPTEGSEVDGLLGSWY